MAYDTLGFALLDKCTASCKHCCFSCSAKNTQKLEICRVASYIEESEKIAEIKEIAFTGGEAFLVYDDLKELMTLSKKMGKRISVATNGFWACDRKTTYRKLEELKNCGLSHLSISFDRYHKEYIDANNIRNILHAALELEISVSVAIVKLKNE